MPAPGRRAVRRGHLRPRHLRPPCYGELAVCRGPGLTWSAPRHAGPSAGLDLSRLGRRRARPSSRTRCAADVAASPTGAGGHLLRGQVRSTDTRSCSTSPARWAPRRRRGRGASAPRRGAASGGPSPDGCAERSAQCFVYDPEWRGVVGQAPSFGSEEFNDHHFHYGYFLYAAGVLAAHDPSLVDDARAGDGPARGRHRSGHRHRLDAAGCGCSTSTRRTPGRPGTAPFADGNNQESSSEAVTAWAGLALWADAAGDDALAAQAAWLLSLEAAGARRVLDRLRHRTLPLEGFAHGSCRDRLGRQARLRDLVLARAVRDPRYPADPDEPVLGLPRRRPVADPGDGGGGDRGSTATPVPSATTCCCTPRSADARCRGRPRSCARRRTTPSTRATRAATCSPT